MFILSPRVNEPRDADLEALRSKDGAPSSPGWRACTGR
jgi:hypothetical protein